MAAQGCSTSLGSTYLYPSAAATARFVTRLEGDADTVIGLSLALLRELLPEELRRQL